jgi:small subunit ribosomal protein S1
LSWLKKINHPSEFIKKGESLEVVVLELDIENRKLRLGHKQLSEDPWERLETVFPVNSSHTGTVIKLMDKGAVVELEYGLEGFVPSKHLKKEGEGALKEGEEASFVVIEFNKEQKKIILSHTKVWKEDEAVEGGVSDQASAKKKVATKTAGASKKKEIGPSSGDKADTLGDLGALAALKAEMEEQERN